DDAPGEPARVEQARVEDDGACGRGRRRAALDHDGHTPRDHAPVERARVERGPNLRLLRRGAAAEGVRPAGRTRTTGERSGGEKGTRENGDTHALIRGRRRRIPAP